MSASQDEYEELRERLEKLEREREIEREVARVINSQKSGMVRYMLEFLKLIAAILVITMTGDKALELPWISDLIK